MARRRMIEVSIAHDKVLNGLSDFAQLLYLKILPHTDDWGRFEGDPELVQARVDPLSKKRIEKYRTAMQEIATAKLWIWYRTDKGKMVVQFSQESFERINAFLIKQRKNPEFPPYKDSYELICSDMPAYTIERESNKIKEKEESKEQKESVLSPKEKEERFKAVWLLYPRREGRKEALKHFMASVSTEADAQKLTSAMENYKSYLKKNKTEAQFIKMGSTWFNQWDDWIPEKKIQSSQPRRLEYLCECGKVHGVDEKCPAIVEQLAMPGKMLSNREV